MALRIHPEHPAGSKLDSVPEFPFGLTPAEGVLFDRFQARLRLAEIAFDRMQTFAEIDSAPDSSPERLAARLRDLSDDDGWEGVTFSELSSADLKNLDYLLRSAGGDRLLMSGSTAEVYFSQPFPACRNCDLPSPFVVVDRVPRPGRMSKVDLRAVCIRCLLRFLASVLAEPRCERCDEICAERVNGGAGWLCPPCDRDELEARWGDV